MMTDLREHFSTLEDPRIDRNKRHELLDIVLVVICGMLSGADGWEAIEEFGKEKLTWLRQFGSFANGVPSHDCIARVISRLSVKGFSRMLSWVGQRRSLKPLAVRSLRWMARPQEAHAIVSVDAKRSTWWVPGRAPIG